MLVMWLVYIGVYTVESCNTGDEVKTSICCLRQFCSDGLRALLLYCTTWNACLYMIDVCYWHARAHFELFDCVLYITTKSTKSAAIASAQHLQISKAAFNNHGAPLAAS